MMANPNQAKLARDEWLRNLRDLGMNSPLNAPTSAARRVRDLNELILKAPEQALVDGLRPVDPMRLEAMLACGAADAAVLAMFAEGASYMISRSGEEMIIATVTLPATVQEKSASGNVPALALVGALARALANAATASRQNCRLESIAAATLQGPHLVTALH